MLFTVGSKIRVRPSKSLGTPMTTATIKEIVAPIGSKDYPYGLALVLETGKRNIDDLFEVDCLGYVYSGPPLNGVLVRFP